MNVRRTADLFSIIAVSCLRAVDISKRGNQHVLSLLLFSLGFAKLVLLLVKHVTTTTAPLTASSILPARWT